MKHIALITLHTPTSTNFRAASALPYHLLAFRPNDVNVEIWSFNLNGCSEEQIHQTEVELRLRVHIMSKPRWFHLLRPALIRLLLPRPVLRYLRLPADRQHEILQYLNNPNSALWIYGEDIAHLTEPFGIIPTVVSTPDCEAMYYHRVLAMKGVPVNKISLLRYAIMYYRYASMAAAYPNGCHIKYHLVGKADALFLKKLNPNAQVTFIRHPHYDVSTAPHIEASNQDPLKILIAGRYDFTMAQAADDALEAILTLPQVIKDKVIITFLGNGWDKWTEKLKKSAFKVQKKKFVDDYAAEVASHHIQLVPVAVGTGTKGKVLDAFVNGLMVIGTRMALENIAVESGKDCVEYIDGSELVHWLERLAISPAEVNDIAKSGREVVLREHSREKKAIEFFKLFE